MNHKAAGKGTTYRSEPLWLRAFRVYFLFVFVVGTCFQGMSPTRAVQAAGEPAMQTYYLSMPEANVRTAFLAIDTGNGDIGNTMVSITSIATTVNGTIIYYDQWEDGYEALNTTPAQASTLVFGDGNTANGNACTYAQPASLCAGDALTSGAVIVLRNSVPSNPRGTATYFDARDKLATTQVVAVTRAMWDSDTGTVLAGALQVYDTSGYGTDFRLPAGENLASASSAMFEYAGLFIMAANDATTVNIDSDGNGTTDYTTTLSSGGAYFLSSATAGVNLNSNARITSTQPIQVNLITGDINSQQKYENRWFNIPPLALLGSSYVTPVSSMSNSNSNVFIYNPSQTSSVTVYRQTSSGTTNFTVTAGATVRNVMPTGSGARFYTNNGAVFMAIGTNDSPAVGDTGGSVGSSWDWGYTLIAEELLAPSLAVGWAPGSNVVPPASNGSPVWVSANAATTIYVDYDGNPATGPNTDINGNHYNTSYTVTALQSIRIYDPDNDQTAMRVYTVDGTLLAAAWGEDTSVAEAVNPYLDMGYVIFPLPQMVLTKDGVLDVTTTTPIDQANAGDVIYYTLKATNNGTRTLTNVTIVDSKLGTLVCSPAQPTTLVSGASMTCTGSYTITAADITAGVVYNAAIGDSNQTPPTTVQEEVKIPLLSVIKTASPTSVPETGGSVIFTFTVKNNNSIASDVSLVILTLSDTIYGALAGDSDCKVGTVLAPQASCDFSITRTVSGDFETSAAHINTFTAVAEDAATGNDPDVSASDNETVTLTDVDPAIDIEKEISVDGGTTWQDVDSATGPLVFSGTTPRFRFVVTNTGPVTLNALSLADPNFASFYQSDLTTACAIPATLAPAASFTCYARLAWAAGQHTNTATATGSMTDGAGVVEPASDSDPANYFGAVPGLNLTKSAVPGTYDTVGQVISYSYVITNTGNYTLSGPFSVTDDKAAVTCTQPGDNALSPGEAMNCTASYTITQADLDADHVTNTATASGGGLTSNQAIATVYAVAHPNLSLLKSADPLTYDAVNDVISYSYVLTNIGNVALRPPYAVSDNKTTVTCPQTPDPLPVGAQITCTATYAITQADLDAGSLTNIATATATFGGNPVTSNESQATVNADQTRSLLLKKTATPTEFDAVGDIISYSYLVTNTGNVTLTDPITVSDNKATVTCPPLPVGGLAPGASITCTATYTITQTDLDGYALTNTATATSGTTVSNEDDETVYAIQTPALALQKTASPATYTAAGQVISYSYVLTNTGNVTLNAPFWVNDDKATVTCDPDVTSLSPGNSLTCSASHTVTQAEVDAGSITNTAQGHASYPDTEVDSNVATATVNAVRSPALTLVKTGSPADYDAVGDVISYTYELTNSGNVTLSAPFTVTDDRALNEHCPDTPESLAPTESITCTASYSITLADIDAGSVVNLATGHAYDGTTPVDSNEDSFSATAIKIGGLGLTKSADPATYDAVGQAITYTYTIQNTGNYTLSGPFSVSDDHIGDPVGTPFECGSGPLAPNATTSCTATYYVTQADLDAAEVKNTATASDGEFTSNEAFAVVHPDKHPALAIDKAAAEAVYAAAGDLIHYSYLVTNTGNVTLSGPFTVSDDKATDETCPATDSLAPGDSITCAATYIIQQSDVDAGGLTNVASATNGTVTSPTDTVTVPATQSPALALAKSANPLTYAALGQEITYDYLLTNTGNVTLVAPFAVSDDKAVVTCPPEVTSLTPGGTLHCTATYTITQPDLDNGFVTNLATATATFGGNPVPSNESQATVNAEQNPALTLVKSADPTQYDAVGDEIDYTYTVTNSGNVTLTGPFTVADDKATVSCPSTATLLPGASITCTATHNITQSDLDAGSVVNTAQAKGSFKGADVFSNEASQTVNAVPAPALSLEKSATPLTYDAVGDVITYTYTLKNIGNVTLTGPFSVDDDKATVTCTDPLDGQLTPQEEMTCSATYTITQADLDAGSVTNLATGHANTLGGTPVNSNNASATVTAIPLPALTIVKTAAPATYVSVGDVISYSFVVTNSGNVTLHEAIVVHDDKATDESCDALPAGGLAPGESINCTASYAITQADLDAGTVTNAAYATSGATQSNTDTETVTAEQNPALSIVKSVTETTYDETTDVLHYSYIVTNTGNVTLEAPFTVHDDKATDESCPAAPGSLTPGASITCTASYAITQADLDAGAVTNHAYATVLYHDETVTSNTDQKTVTATQLPALALVKEGSFEMGPDGFAAPGELISYSFSVTNTGNITLHNVLVTDPLMGMSAITCEGGSNPIAVLEVGVTRYCTATYPVTQVDIDRGYVDNTATADSNETGPVTDDNHEELPQLPGLALDKTVTSTGPYDSVGDLIEYQMVATNTGLMTLTNVTITDHPLAGGLTCSPEQPATLAPGATLTCTGAYSLQQSDLNGGSVTNVATADADQTDPVTDTITVPLSQSPALALEKSVTSTGPYDSVGDVIAYQLVATNTGNITLHGVSITDPKLGELTCDPVQPASLAPTQTLTCTGAHTLSQADLDAGSYYNIATADSNETGPVTDDVTVPMAQAPALTLDKTGVFAAGADGYANPGELITYSFVVTNTGNLTLHNVTVTDPLPGLSAISCPKTTLVVGESMTCTATYAVTQVDIDAGSVHNLATADSDESGPDTGENTEPLPQNPAMTIDKSSATSSLSAPATVTYDYLVTNAGNVTLTGIVLSDNNDNDDLVCPFDTLAVGASMTCHATHTFTQAELDAGGTLDNTVTADSAQTEPVTDSLSIPISQSGALTVEKSSATTSLSAPATVTYDYLVTNTGNLTLTGITLSDDNDNDDLVCPATTLAVGASMTCHATHTFTQTELDAGGSLDNIVTADSAQTEPVTDSLSIPITQNPALTVEKSSATTSLSAPATVTYDYVVTNTGNVTLTGIFLSDDNDNNDMSCPATTLAVGGSMTCHATHTFTQAELDAGGTLDNTVTADSNETLPVTDSLSIPITRNAGISLVKTSTFDAGADGYANVGELISYEFVVTNTGNTTLTGITVSDPKVTPIACPADTLAVSASMTCTGTYAVTQADIDAGLVYNMASADSNETGPATDDNTQPLPQNPAIRIVKGPELQKVAEGATVTFNITVTNTGNVSLTNVDVTDALAPDCNRSDLSLAAGEESTYQCTAVASADFTNVAVVTGSGPQDQPVTDDDNAVVDVLPTIAVIKLPEPAAVSEPGANVTFTVSVQNTSPEDVSLTSLVDSVYGDLNGQGSCVLPQTIAPDASYTCTFTKLISGDAGSSHTNIVTGTASDNDGNPVDDTGTATVTVNDVLPTVTLDKSVTPDSLPEPGGVFTYTLTITNTSVEPVTITTLIDSNALSPECDALVGDVLAPDETVSCQYTVTQTEAGSYGNQAYVYVEDNEGNPAEAGDTANVIVTPVAPGVNLLKTVTPETLPEPGGVFTYTLEITNNSVEEVTITALTDSNALSQQCLDLIGTKLAAGASTSCAYTVTHTEAGVYDNTADVIVTDNEGDTASDTDDASVTVTPVAPVVDLEKVVSPASLAEPGGVFTYTLTITNNSVEAVTITALTDDNPLSPECDALVGDTLAVGASVSCDYTVTRTEEGIYPNTAQVTVADNEGATASDQASASVEVTGVAPVVDLQKSVDPESLAEPGGVFTYTLSITNNSVEPVTITALTDGNALSPECTTLIGTSLAVGQTVTCAYTVTRTEAGTYPNTANVTVTDNEGDTASDTATATATVTNVLPTVTLDKSVTPTTLPEPGGVFTYTLTITNTSVEPVTITTLTDDNPLSPECDALVGDVLPVGGSASCEYSVTFTDDGQYVNYADVTVTDNEGSTVSDDDVVTVTVTDMLPDVALVKSVTPTTLPEPGGAFTFTLLITNNSVEPVTITALTDDNPLPAECTDLIGTVLTANGGTATCSYQVTHIEPDDYLNEASVSVTDDDDNIDSATDEATVTVTDVLPTVTLDKSVTPATLPEPGGVFTYTLTITNNSVEPVTITALTDDNTLSPECDALVGEVLPVGGSASCEYSATFTNAGTYPNTAHVTVRDNESNPASDSDDASVEVNDTAPGMYVTKTASPTHVPETGGNVTFTFDVVNISVEAITLNSLTDTVFGDLDGQGNCDLPQEIAVDGHYTCAITVFLASDSLTAHTNVVTAAAVDNDGTPVSDDDDATVTFDDVAPVIEIIKTADPTTLPETGGEVTFTFQVNNIGPEDVTLTSLTDSAFGNLNGQGTCAVPQTILIGGAYTCTVAKTLASDSLTAHTNVVTASAVDDDNTPATDDDDATVSFTDVAPAIEILKTASPTHVPETGGEVTFTFQVNNTGAEDVTLTSLTDTVFGDLDGKGTCVLPQTILIGQSYSCTYAVTLAADDLAAHTNVVTASAVDDDNTPATDDDDATVSFDDVSPLIQVTKTANPTSLPETGGDATFTFLVENIGPEDVTLTSLTDDAFGNLNGQGDCVLPQVIVIGGSYSCSFSTYLTSDDLIAHTNVVTASAVDDDGTTASDTDDETVTFTDVGPVIRVTKTASPTHVPETGGEVTFTFLVENTGQEDVTLTSLVDTVFGDLNGKGDCILPQPIVIGGSYSCAYPVTLAADDLTAHTNVVTAGAVDDDGTTATDDDDATVSFDDVAPAIAITKTASPTHVAETGGEVTFTFQVNNTGVEDVTLTSLTDSVFGDLDGQGTCAVPQTILIGGSYICTVTKTLASDSLTAHTNVVTAVGTDDDGTSATATDDATVTFDDVAPSILVTKTADPTSLPETGGDVTFTFVVTNDGVEDVTLTSLTDSVFGDLDGQGTCSVPQTIAIGGSYSCAVTKFLSSDSLTAHTNVVTASAVDDDDTPASDTDDETVTFTDVAPAIEVLKTADPAVLPETGGEVTFTFQVNNTGPEEVTLTSLTDTVFGDLDGKGTCDLPQTIIIGGSYSCEYSVTLSSDSLTAHTNVVTAGAVDDDGTPATDDDSETVTFDDVAPAITLSKSANPTHVPETGGEVTFTFLVNNTGQEEVTLNSLVDTVFGNLDGKGTCDLPQTIAIGGSYICTYAVTLAADDLVDHTNVVTASAVDDDGTPATDDDSETVTFDDVAPAITVIKTASPTHVPETGGEVTFTFLVNNTGPEEITLTNLTDTVFGNLDGQGTCAVPQTIAIGGSYTCTVTKFLASDSLTAHTNVVAATAVDDDGTPAAGTDDATVTFDDVAPAITLSKSANPTHVPETGADVTFTFQVNNIGQEDVTLNSLTDTVFGNLDGQGTCDLPQTIAIGGSYSCSITTFLAGSPLTSHHNVATASVTDDDGTSAADDDDETVTFDEVLPTVDLTKSVDSNGTFNIGETATFTLTIKNTSLETVTITALTDTNPLPAACTDLIGATLLPEASVSCSYSMTLTVAGTYNNTAAVTVVDAGGNTVTDEDTETITYYAPVLSKTANGTYDEIHDWNVTKSVDKTFQYGIKGQTVNFTWTVVVDEKQTGENYNVSGAITIANPNPDDPMTLALTDTLDDGTVPQIGPCTGGSIEGNVVTVPPATTVTCAYTAVPQGKAGSFNAALPDQVTMTVTGGYSGGPAYFPTTTVTDGGALNGTYEGWCADIDRPIEFNQPYLANVYSSLESLPAGLIENAQNLDLVNWIINQEYVGKPSGAGDGLGNFTYGDVQRAIWELIEDNGTASTAGLGAWNQTRVNLIKQAALANGEGFAPHCGDSIAVILQPVTGKQLVTIAQVTFASLGIDCAESNAVTAVFNGFEFHASADIVWVPNQINGTATLDDLEVPEWPITVSEDGTFTYVDSYTCSSDPSDYPSGYYRYYETNTATLTFGDSTANATANTEVKCYSPVLDVTKDAKQTKVPQTGGNVTYVYTVRNPGIGPLTITSLVDDKFGALAGDYDCQVGTQLAAGASCSFEATFLVPAGMPNKYHVNIFTANAVDPLGNTATDSDAAEVKYIQILPDIKVIKTADKTSIPETGADVTFTFQVMNIGAIPVTITSLSDSVFGTLSGDEDCQVGTVLAVGGSCEFSTTQFIYGDATSMSSNIKLRSVAAARPGFETNCDPVYKYHYNVFTAKAADSNGVTDTATDDEKIILVDGLPQVTVMKDANPTSVSEPGGYVAFTFTVKNPGAESIKIVSLTDSKFGTLTGDTDCKVGTWLVAGASCDFKITKKITGEPGATHINTFTAGVVDNENNKVTASDDATVTIIDALPSISVTKSANKTSVLYSGEKVTFTVKVKNTGGEAVTITSLVDDMFGDLNGQGTCAVPKTLLPGATYSCYFYRTISATLTPYQTSYHVDTVTAEAKDNEGNIASGSGTVSIKFYWRGRTPGYWKNKPTSWPAFYVTNHLGTKLAVKTTTPVTSVFNIPASLLKCTGSTCILDLNDDNKNDTLIQALAYQGGSDLKGKGQILLRAAVAALLNEQYFGAGYPAYNSVADLLAGVNATLATQDLQTYVDTASVLDWWNNGVH